MRRNVFIPFLILALLGGAAIGACGGDDAPAEPTTAAETTATDEVARLEARVERLKKKLRELREDQASTTDTTTQPETGAAAPPTDGTAPAPSSGSGSTGGSGSGSSPAGGGSSSGGGSGGGGGGGVQDPCANTPAPEC